MKKSLLSVLMLIGTTSLFANVLTVTSSGDTGTGSLRAQIAAANPGDTIAFDASINGTPIVLTNEIAFSKNLVILGNGTQNTILDGNSSSRILSVSSTDSLTLSFLTIQNGSATGTTGNDGKGGAIFAFNVVKVILNGVNAEGNYAEEKGGAIGSFANAYPIYVDAVNCTFLNDTSGVAGGAIYCDNPNQNTYVSTMNSTFIGNSSDHGGGIYVAADISGWTAHVTIKNSTLVNNNATSAGGAVYAYGATSSVNIQSSIIAFNGTSNIFASSSNISSQGYNIFSDAAIAGTVGTDQMGATASTLNLGMLQDNGGDTKTVVPGCGSIAINMGDPTDFSAAQNGPVRAGRREVGAAETVAHTDTISAMECSSYTVPSGDSTYTTIGNYYVQDTIPTTCGSDSIITIDLTITGNTTLHVLNTDDAGVGSLRQTVADACPGDTITFDPSTDGTPIVLTSGKIDIAKDLTIIGNGTAKTIVDGNHISRTFYAKNGSIASIQKLTVQHGYTIGSHGGGMAVDGATLNLDYVNIVNCEAGAGTFAGAIYLGSATAHFNHCIFSGNIAGANGGAIYQIYGGSLLIENSVLSGNVAGISGGAFYSSAPSQVKYVNVTMTGNYAGYMYGGSKNGFTAVNTIIWGNKAEDTIDETDPSTSIFTYSIIKGINGVPGAGNIDGTSANAPLFVQPIVADTIPSTAGDFQLGAGSKLIDNGLDLAANSMFDLAGNTRILDGTNNGIARIDLGAYEFVSTAGVKSQQAQANVKLFPNPVNKHLTVAVNSTIKQLQVYSISGQLMKSMQPLTSSVQLDFSAYAKGTYLVKIRTAHQVVTKRVVKK